VPRTKCNQLEGEDLYWVAQPLELEFCDPVWAMRRHLDLNNPGPDEHIFAYRTEKGHHFLTKAAFTTELKNLAELANISSEGCLSRTSSISDVGIAMLSTSTSDVTPRS
jgi:hypothetical protein